MGTRADIGCELNIVVSVPSRVHMTLIDLGQHGYRRNGGIGFAVESPARDFMFSRTTDFDIRKLVELGYVRDDISQLRLVLADAKRKYGMHYSITLDSAKGSGRHIGTGSGTAVTLACLEALFHLNGIPIEPIELAQLSGRGGASGIGIHTYFYGGFVVDIGRKFDKCMIKGSDETQNHIKLPQLLTRYSMPNWRIGLLFPPLPPLTHAQEKSVFESLSTNPIPLLDVCETSYHCLFGSTAAVVTADFESFCDSVNALQKTAWKIREINAHGNVIASIMERMRNLGCDCVGLSSMGPGLYFLATEFDKVKRIIAEEFPEAQIVSTIASNHGREINDA